MYVGVCVCLCVFYYNGEEDIWPLERKGEDGVVRLRYRGTGRGVKCHTTDSTPRPM